MKCILLYFLFTFRHNKCVENMSFDDCILYDQYTIKPILIFQLFSNTSNAIIKVFCMSEHHF